ncbi:MAG: TonB-dependent receptor [Gemmatimonadales bacterium]
MKMPTMVVMGLVGAACVLPAQGTGVPQVLPDRTVTVTRRTDSLATLGASVSVVDGAAVMRGHLATGLDEALAFVPGVVTGNRWNYSLDQRLSIRGAGARANFGVRGIKILIDGVPQTLPDGQSQLSNLDLARVERIEVLRGAASALEGNAAGGVIAFTTRGAPAEGSDVSAGFEHGAFGAQRWQGAGAVRWGALGTSVAISRFTTEGFRQHSVAEQLRASFAIDWAVTPTTTFTLRTAVADDPRAENPGALTTVELAARRDSASAGNIRRGADKHVSQQQVAVGARGFHSLGAWSVTLYGLHRDLVNPLATPPPRTASPNEGTFVTIDRAVMGARASVNRPLGTGPHAVQVAVGADMQAQHDDRENRRSLAGVPGADILLAQRENVREIGTFVQATIPIATHWRARAGARHDWTRFTVRDELTSDGDASGERTMAAASGHLALTWLPIRILTAWASVATSFETPTTTELVNRIEGDGGFNTQLDPQRSVATEVGVRAAHGPWRVEVAAYRNVTRDALVAFREIAGRSFFRNAGQTRTTGIEVAASVAVARSMSLLASVTHTNAIFTDYTLMDGAEPVDLGGRRLPGVPATVARIGVQGMVAGAIGFDVDHAWSSSMPADDRNLIVVPGWGWGVTGVRARWERASGRYRLQPFAGVSNVFNRAYVGSVTINGAGGRVFEPSPGRIAFVGASIGRK